MPSRTAPRTVGVSLAVALLASACSVNQRPSSGSTSTGPSSAPAGTTTTSTTTTTTLPAPLPAHGTALAGSNSFLGPVERVPVIAIPAGSSSAPLPVAGQPGFLSIERIAFRRFGSGKNLLLIMGQDGTMAWWEPSFLALLAQHYTVTIFDLPGIGYSAPASSAVTPSWLADETAGLIQALSLVHPTVLGWGLGGDVALSLVERHPAIVGSLALVDTSAGGPGTLQPASAVSTLFDSPWATATSLAPTIFGPSVTSASTVPSSLPPPSAASTWLSGVRSTPDAVTQTALTEERAVQASVWSSGSLAESAESVTVPTLVAYGTDDVVFPAPDGPDLAGLIPGAHRLAVAGAGYASMFEEPSVYVAALEQFTG